MGQWHLDGDATDSSGNGHNGTISGATSTAGKLGLAYSFNGQAYINVGNLDFSNGTYTVSLWLRTTRAAVAEDWRMAIAKSDSALSNPFEILIQDGRGTTPNSLAYMVWNRAVGLVDVEDSSGTNARDGQWHMATVTYAQGEQHLYVDGALVGSAAYAGVLPSTSTAVLIGGSDFGSYHHRWIGDIDEVSIYSRPLTAAEVAALYGSF